MRICLFACKPTRIQRLYAIWRLSSYIQWLLLLLMRWLLLLLMRFIVFTIQKWWHAFYHSQLKRHHHRARHRHKDHHCCCCCFHRSLIFFVVVYDVVGYSFVAIFIVIVVKARITTESHWVISSATRYC